MHIVADQPTVPVLRLPIRTVSATRPFVWLVRAVVDLSLSFRPSCAHGLAMTALGWALLIILGTHPYLVMASVTGFLLVAPIMSTGICELSRRLHENEPLSFELSLEPLRRDGAALFSYGLVLAAVAVVWLLVSEVMLTSVLHMPRPSFADAFWLGMARDLTSERIVAYVAVGAVLALFVFSLRYPRQVFRTEPDLLPYVEAAEAPVAVAGG